MHPHSKIFVAGHKGLVGSALVKALQSMGFHNLVCRTRAELNLVDQLKVKDFFAAERPDYVFLSAAVVGGIHANDAYPAQFIYDNLVIQSNVIDAAYRNGATKLLFLGSSCIYPKFAEQPIRETSLLTGPLEPTNEWYAIAKIAGLKMCQAYRKQYGFDAISVMPTNLYGPGDRFDSMNSHVVPSLMMRFHAAKLHNAPKVVVWGTGAPRREFMHVDDLADACLFLMRTYSAPEHLNVGWGEDISIRSLAELVARVVGFSGALEFDVSKPDGTPRKLLDTTQLRHLDWMPRIPLEQGLRETYRWYLDHHAHV
jgi:GDP-L-fucose synthase